MAANAPAHNGPRFLAAVERARKEISECSIEEFQAMVTSSSAAEGSASPKVVVLDVREKHEFDAGHYIHAVHVGKGVLERDIEQLGLEDDAKIVCYCGGGFRSALATQTLGAMGWKNATSLWGGWKAIAASGLPVTSPASTPPTPPPAVLAGAASASGNPMVHVIAAITALPGQRDAVLRHFQANVPAVLAENGCIEYGATVDASPAPPIQVAWGPDTFVVVEKWASMDALAAHAGAPHMLDYGQKTAELVASKAIYIMSNV
jgi:quinol monooxygenase YgiN/rhodanese-related sulfurtransferase